MPKDRYNPSSFVPLLDHLVLYGEVSAQEAKKFNASDAIAFLETSGYLLRRRDLWVVTSRFLKLFPVDNLTALTRKIFFSHPGYRRYMTTIVTVEIARRGLEGAMEHVENWVVNDFPHLARDINQFLDRIENELVKLPLKDCSTGDLLKGFKAIIEEIQGEEEHDFEAWNKELLGVCGNQEAVFQAILARNALSQSYATTSSQKVEEAEAIVEDQLGWRAIWEQNPIRSLHDELLNPNSRPVLLPHFGSNEEEKISREASENSTVEHYIFSRVEPFLSPTLQNPSLLIQPPSFLAHPIPWLLVQIAIIDHLSQSGGEEGKVALCIKNAPQDGCFWVEVMVDHFPCGSFAQILPDLLKVLGFKPILPFGPWTENALSPLYKLLLKNHILDMEKQRLVLAKAFQNRLYERSLINILLRNQQAKEARAQIRAKLETMVSDKQCGDTI